MPRVYPPARYGRQISVLINEDDALIMERIRDEHDITMADVLRAAITAGLPATIEKFKAIKAISTAQESIDPAIELARIARRG
jgi:hypothetical protein